MDALADTMERGRMMDELNHIIEMNLEKVKAKAFAEGWNACLEKMPRVKTLTGFMVADGKIFDGDEREIMWDKVREIMEKQMLAKLKDVIEYTTTEEEDNIVIIRGKLLVVKKEEREKAINEKAVHFDVLQRDTNQL